MKFIVDNQLPAALSEYLRKRGFESQHVSDIALDRATDREICHYAIANDSIIISKDQDFLYLAGSLKWELGSSGCVWVTVERQLCCKHLSGSCPKSRQP